MKTYNNILQAAMRTAGAAMMVALMLGMVACSSGNDTVEPTPVTPPTPETPTPETPTEDGDWHTVSSAGGTIEKGDISITFPSGTFSTDTKVALTEVAKGDILGNDEASVFYQLTVPAQVEKPFTVKIKCAEQGEGINVVAHIPSFRVSEEEATYSDIILPSEYANGEYTATMPESSNKNTENYTIPLCFGVAHYEYWGVRGSQAKATRAADAHSQYAEAFTEGNFSWHLNLSRGQIMKYDAQLSKYYDDIHKIIREAIKKIHDLGFMTTKRDVAIDFVEMKNPDPKDTKLDKFGTFNQSAWKNELSTVSFNELILTDFDTHRNSFKASAIHELTHDFQADYDVASTKWFFRREDDRVLMYECGAVWVEQFMTGSFSVGFAKDYISDFVKGFTDNIYDIHKDDPTTKGSTYMMHSHHGYGMSSLLQYLSKECTDYNMNDKSIVGLYKKWFEKDKITKETFKMWTEEKGYDITFPDHYDEFLVSLLSGNLIKGYSINDAAPTIKSGTLTNSTLQGTAAATCYPLGCAINVFNVNITGKKLTDKKLVIKQLQEGARTYVLTIGSGKNEYERRGYRAVLNDSIVIMGSQLEKDYYNEANGNTKMMLYVFTTPNDASKGCTSKVSVEIQKIDVSVSPTELNFPAAGGTKDVTVNYGTYKRYGATVRAEGKGWVSVKASGGKISITTTANDTGKKRECYVDCYVTNVQNATDAEKVFMPVKVTQEANTAPTFQPRTDINHVDIMVNIKALRSDNKTVTIEEDFEQNDDRGGSEKINVTKSGNTLKISGSMGVGLWGASLIVSNAEYSMTIQYDNSGMSEITELKLTAKDVMGDYRMEYKLEAKGIKQDYAYNYNNTNKNAYVTWETTEAKGMRIGEFSCLYDYWSNGIQTRTFKYVSDPTNKIRVRIDYGK